MYNRNVYKYDDMKRREHMAVRTSVGYYLFTHQLLEVTGEDSVAFLEWVYPKSVGDMVMGSSRYIPLLDEAAEIIDDIILMRTDEQRFVISTLFLTKHLAWISDHAGIYRVSFRDITKQYHMFAVQGPNSLDMMNALLEKPIDSLKFFHFCDNKVDDIPVKVHRAGFTGEARGYELYFAAAGLADMEAKLAAAGKAFDAVEVTEFQVMAWTLPTEAGYYYLRDLLHTNPFEVGLTHGIAWDREFFGKEALLKIREEGAKREMLGFTMAEDDAAVNGKDQGGPGDAVIANGEEVGRVSKFNYSFVKESNVGYILAKKGALKKGDTVRIRRYDAVITDKKFL